MVRLEARHFGGIGLGILVLVVDFIFFLGSVWLVPFIVVGITFMWSQFWFDYFASLKRRRQIEARFPDFVRNLVSSIKSGMPVSRAIIYSGRGDYAALSKHTQKLANQVEWAIPIHTALNTFARDTKSVVIKRAIATVIEAEQSGGNIQDVLEAVTNSVIQIKKIKQRRKAAVHSQVVQNYIIFIIFLSVMIVVQNLVVPFVGEITGQSVLGATGLDDGIVPTGISEGITPDIDIDFSSFSTFIRTLGEWFTTLKGIFLSLAIIQGLFAGLIVGKLSEGEISAGVKHALILMTIAFFVMSLAG